MVRRSTVRIGALLVASMLVAALPATARQTDDAALRADIKKLLEAMGSAQMGSQMAGIMADQMVMAQKGIVSMPARAAEITREVLNVEFGRMFEGEDSVMPQLVDIYANHLTRDDVRQLLDFYGSDVGKKLVQTLPAVMKESAGAGQAWAQKHMPRIMGTLQARLRAEGLIK